MHLRCDGVVKIQSHSVAIVPLAQVARAVHRPLPTARILAGLSHRFAIWAIQFDLEYVFGSRERGKAHGEAVKPLDYLSFGDAATCLHDHLTPPGRRRL
jgi:hypothetical protein